MFSVPFFQLIVALSFIMLLLLLHACIIAIYTKSRGKFEIRFPPFEDLFQQNGISQRESSHKFPNTKRGV